MQGMTTLGKVFYQVEEMSKSCHDLFVATPDISFDDLKTVRIAGEARFLRPTAQTRIAARLGIPLQYLGKCPAEVQVYNLKHWIRKERNPRLFFRFDGDEVRALFTPKYRPMDNTEILERLHALEYGHETRVQCCLDGDFMSLSIPDGHKTFAVNGGRLTPGISISNSEVGLASLRIATFYLRLVCTNGLIAKAQVSTAYRHVSRKIMDDFDNVFADVAKHQLHQRERFQISMDSRVDDPSSTMQAFNKQFLLGEAEQEAVAWGWLWEPGHTMFHIINAYTRVPCSPACRQAPATGCSRWAGRSWHW
jgi:hypothetical protein